MKSREAIVKFLENYKENKPRKVLLVSVNKNNEILINSNMKKLEAIDMLDIATAIISQS